MGCVECQNGEHVKCIEVNKDKTTGCPGNCQHRKTTKVEHAGVVYNAPEGVTGVVVSG
jgi:hypothetical protein